MDGVGLRALERHGRQSPGLRPSLSALRRAVSRVPSGAPQGCAVQHFHRSAKLIVWIRPIHVPNGWGAVDEVVCARRPAMRQCVERCSRGCIASSVANGHRVSGSSLVAFVNGLSPRWCSACRAQGSLRGGSQGSPHVCVGTGGAKWCSRFCRTACVGAISSAQRPGKDASRELELIGNRKLLATAWRKRLSRLPWRGG